MVNSNLVQICLFIASGALVAILIGLCIKRQITRFTLKTKRLAHMPIGSGLPKSMKQELISRINRTAQITTHPQLLCPVTEKQWSKETREGRIHFLYRMKAMDATKKLENALIEHDASLRRPMGDDLRAFLLKLQEPGGALRDVSKEGLSRLAEMYLHARYDPLEFTEDHYTQYEMLVNTALTCLRSRQAVTVTGTTESPHQATQRKPSSSDGTSPHRRLRAGSSYAAL